MKIAILSDIHGNMAALEAVAVDLTVWQPDQVVVNGDTVNRGPQTAAVWAYVTAATAQNGWQLLRGNHEGYIISREWLRPDLSPVEREFVQLSRWSYRQHGGDVAEMAALPEGCTIIGPDGGEIRVRHASMLGDRDGIYADTPAAWVRKQIDPAPPVFLTAHTHRPFVRRIEDTLLANSGSVGVPLDGDRRASYLRLSWSKGDWEARIRRVRYDRAATQDAFRRSGFLTESGAASRLLYMEWERARPLLPDWFREYDAALQRGEITVGTAVTRFLDAHDLRYRL